MRERSLPASPNWYCSRCSDVSSSGLLGVGAKNVIYLIDVSASSCRVAGEWAVTAGHHTQHRLDRGIHVWVPAARNTALNSGTTYLPDQIGEIRGSRAVMGCSDQWKDFTTFDGNNNDELTKNTPKVSVKKCSDRLIHCVSLYGPHVLVLISENVRACS